MYRWFGCDALRLRCVATRCDAKLCGRFISVDMDHPRLIMHRMGGSPNAQRLFCTLTCLMYGFLACGVCGFWFV